MRSIAIALISGLLLGSIGQALADEITLSQSDAETLQTIVRKDKFLRALGKEDGELKDLGILNRIASMAISGPVSIAIKWNQGLISGWRTANTSLVSIGKLSICEDIALAQASSDHNSSFFENMYRARGCD